MSRAGVVHNQAVELAQDGGASHVDVEALLRAVVDTARLLLASPDVIVALPAILEVVLRAADMDRVCLLRRDPLRAQWHHVAQIQSRGSAPYDTSAFPLPETAVPDVFAELLADRCWNALHSERVGTDLNLNPRIESVGELIVPIFCNGQCWGCLGLDALHFGRQRHIALLHTLRSVASVIGAALAREQSKPLALTAQQSQECLLGCVAAGLRALSNEGDLDRALHTVTTTMVRAPRIGRCYVFVDAACSSKMMLLAEDNKPGIPRILESFGSVIWHDDDFPSIGPKLRVGRVVQSQHDDRACGDLEVNRAARSPSRLILPIMIGTRFWGALGFDDFASQRTFGQDEVLAVQSLSTAIAAKVERSEATERIRQMLRNSTERLAAASDPRAVIREVLLAGLGVLASSGAIGCGLLYYMPDKRALRIEDYVLHGRSVDLSGTVLGGSFPIDAPTMRGPWQRVQNEDWIWGLTSDTRVLVPETREFHESNGSRAVAYLALRRGPECIGCIAYNLASETPPDEQSVGHLQTLGMQIALALEISRLNDAASEAALARERESQARVHADELAQVNSLLIDATATMQYHDQPEELLPSLLHELQERIGTAWILLFDYDSALDQISLRLTFHDCSAVWGLSGAHWPFLARPFPSSITPAWAVMREHAGRLFTSQMIPIPFEEFCWPGAIDVLEREGASDAAHIQLIAGSAVVGSMGMLWTDGRRLQEADRPYIESLARQIAVAKLWVDSSLRARDAAVAQDRLADLSRANDLLRQSVDRLASAESAEALLGSFLLQAVEVTQAAGGAVLRRVLDTEYDFVAVAEEGKLVFDLLRDDPLIEEARRVTHEDRTGAFARMNTGADVWINVDENLASWAPGAFAYHSERGHVGFWHWPYRTGGQVSGYLALAYCEGHEPIETIRETLRVLSSQAALAMEVRRLSQQAQAAELTRERLAVIGRAHEALRRTADKLADEPALETYLGHALQSLVDAFGGIGGTLLRSDGEGVASLLELTRGELKLPEESMHPLHRSPPRLPQVQAWESRMLCGEVVAVDVDREYGFDPEAQAYLQSMGVSTLVMVPLNLGDRHLGRFTLRLAASQKLDAEELALTRALATQAALALELTRLADEAREAAVARERELAAREQAEQLAAANESLRRSVERIVTRPELNSLVEAFLVEAVQTIGATGGALFLRVPGSVSAFRAVAWYDDGHIWSQQEIQAEPFASRFVEWSEQDSSGVFAALARGETPSLRTAELREMLPEAYAYHIAHDQRASWNAPLVLHGRVLGFAGFALQQEALPSDASRQTVVALAQQYTLALELTRLAEEAREAAVAREQALSAKLRTDELERTQAALQQTIDVLQEVGDIEQVVPSVLDIIARTFGAEVCAAYENEPGGFVRLKFWHVGGQTYTPSQLLASGLLNSDAAAVIQALQGFTVPDSYLGTPTRQAVGVFALDHRRGTSVPEFDRLAVSSGLEMELNIGVGQMGVRRATLCIYRPAERPFSDEERALAESLAKQMALAMVISQAAKEASEASVLREREHAVLARAALLERSNTAMQRTVDQFANIGSLAEAVPGVLRIVAAAFGAHHCAYSEFIDGCIYVRHWYWQGQVLKTHELSVILPEQEAFILRLGEGFRADISPIAHAALNRRHPYVVNHLESVGDAQARAFRRSLSWDLELNIPLVVDSQALGGLMIFRTASEPFSEDEVALGAALGKQLALAVQVTLRAEREREAESARAVAAERERIAALQVRELSAAQQCLRESGLKLQTLEALDDYLLELVKAAATLLGAEGGAFGLLDAENRILSIKGSLPGTVSDQTLLSKASIIDLTTQPYTRWKSIVESQTYWWAGIDEAWFADIFCEHDGSRGRTQFAHFPVRSQGKAIGLLVFAFQPDSTPSSTAVDVVQILTEHAALAVQVSRVAAEARTTALVREREQAALRRTQELIQTNEALKRGVARLADDVDIGDFLDQLLAEAARQVGARTNSILLHDDDHDTLTLCRHYTAGVMHKPAEALDSPPAPAHVQDIPLWTQVQRGWVMTHDPDDVAACERLLPPSGAIGHLTVLAVPMSVGGRVIGFMAPAFVRRVDIRVEQVELVQALAHQATLALELTRLSRSARNAVARQAASDERARIAGEIHDSLAQNFTSIAIQGEMLAKKMNFADDVQSTLRLIAQTARLGLAEARATVLTMRTLDVEAARLESALEQLAERCTVQGVVSVTVAHQGPAFPLGAEAANAFLRVAQEAVTNALRHARAGHIDIELCVAPDSVCLVVQDNGVGLDERASRSKSGYGLASMRARAAALGAELTIAAGAAGGTRLTLMQRVELASSTAQPSELHGRGNAPSIAPRLPVQWSNQR